MEEIQTLQQINVLGDTTLTGQINVTNDRNSTSFTSGSIVLAGGLGIAKDVFVNGISHTTNMHLLDASGTTVANQYFNGTTWKIENQVGNQNKTLDITQSAVTLNQTTPATSTVTGAITVMGGISTQDNVWARGNIVGTNTLMTPSTPPGADSSIKNGIVFNSNSGLVNDNSGNLLMGVNTNHFGIRNNATQGGVIKINTDASANSVFDFSAIVSGSTGQTSLLTIEQNGSVKVPSSTNSNSTTTGALQVAGGMAVAKNVNVGGTLALWDGANSGTINETSATLNISSTKINLSGNVQLDGNVQISGNVTLNGSIASGSTSSSTSTSTSTTIQLEPAGANWSAYAIPQKSIWVGTSWSPEKRIFVSLSNSGAKRVMTSPDGVNWTLRDAANNAITWDSVSWSSKLGIFCAVGSTGSGSRTMTSTDGFTWSSVASSVADTRTWYDICWSPDREIFCAVGPNGIMTSVNGTTWTFRTNGVPSSDWRSVVWSPQLGIFCTVAMSGTTRIAISSNGIDWTGVNPNANNAFFGLAWSPQLGLFCAVGVVGSTATRLMTSSNGTTWTSRTPTTTLVDWMEVEWSPEMGLFCAVGGSNSIMTSFDGINWRSRTSTVSSSVAWRSLAWSPELKMFVAVSESDAFAMISTPINYNMNDSNNLDDSILHTHIYNLENPSTTKTMLTSSYSLKDYSTTTSVILAPNGLHFYAVRLTQGQIVKGVFFWSNSTNAIIVRTGLYSADGTLKVSLNENQTITGNNMKYLPLTNSTWTVDATGIFYVGILGVNNENDAGEGATGDFSLLFNRSSYGIAGTSYNGYSTGTIEIWVRNSGIVNDLQIIYGVRPRFVLMLSSGNRLSTFDYGANLTRESNIYITDGNWHHIALTFELGTSNNKIYYDGVPVLTGFPMSAGTQTLTHLIVGRLSDITAAGFQGFCDNARIWNTVRSDAEILASYNRFISPNSTGLTGYWLFNEGTGTTSVNQVSGGESFTFVNTPVWSAGSGTTKTNSIYLIATPTNAYLNYGQTPATGKLSSTASLISSQTSMPATISGLTPTALTNLAYTGVYKDGV